MSKNMLGEWIEYGSLTTVNVFGSLRTMNVLESHKSDVTSTDVEQAYQRYLQDSSQSPMTFKTNQYSYELYFDRTPMVQKNLDPRVRNLSETKCVTFCSPLRT